MTEVLQACTLTETDGSTFATHHCSTWCTLLTAEETAAARLARDAAAAAAAKEAEANRLKPNEEEHTRGLGPLESEHARLAK